MAGRVGGSHKALGQYVGGGTEKGESWVGPHPGKKKEKNEGPDDRLSRRLGHQLPQKKAPAAKMFPIDAIYDQHLIDETRMAREFRYRSNFDGGDVQETRQQMLDGLGFVF